MAVSTPVAIFVFNRPEQTRVVLDALKLVEPSKLYVIADGPRPDNLDDEALCAEVKGLFSDPGWTCEVKQNYSDINLGCRERFISGLNWLFDLEHEAIILEDDTVPETSFFPYCEELLARYRTEEKVHLIRGHSGLPESLVSKDSYYFSRWHAIWGWATWARAWHRFDPDMKSWPEKRSSGWLYDYLPTQEMAKVMDYLFEGSYSGEIKGWANQWFYCGWEHDSYAIAPQINLVTNIGFGDHATHTKKRLPGLADLPSKSMRFPLSHPCEINAWDEGDYYEWKLSYKGIKNRLSFFNRIKRRLATSKS